MRQTSFGENTRYSNNNSKVRETRLLAKDLYKQRTVRSFEKKFGVEFQTVEFQLNAEHKKRVRELV